MIIPRFSLRWLLALITVCGGLSLILSYAFQNHSWAIATIVGLGSLLVVVALHAVAFSVAWLLTQFSYMATGSSTTKAGGGQSPFGGGSPFAPPQAADPEPPAIMS
jgi:hypothetical protein